ncbi:hypothetical protein VKI22_03580 [Cyanobacterium aponinum UTEX 3221]|uniref:hypothetical protein n=1 Tax=Cyanobacterium aponinum TaxID=379064 RepID=UPI002B4BF499|nr:hypothetical protein [Cyanobacterium aponinum]WRL39192.1 hypothetical protein VKI22_03580 [Cyanobacterium aponinum UTEX 3221]
MQKLIKYLASLNSTESQVGIWVNPNNLDDFRIGRFCYENGGVLDEKFCIGHLSDLSFGFYYESDILKDLIQTKTLNFKGKELTEYFEDLDTFINDYLENNLDTDLYEFLKNLIVTEGEYCSLENARLFVEDLKFAIDSGVFFE